MATWTTIPDSSLEPGKPIRSIDALALRDNPVAIAEGESGAPRIVDAALGTTATNTGRDWVLARTALTEHDSIGSITVAWNTTTTNVASNGTIAGSSLRFLSAAILSSVQTTPPANQFANVVKGSGTFPTISSAALSGTWRNIGGYCRGRLDINAGDSYAWFPSVWLRIA